MQQGDRPSARGGLPTVEHLPPEERNALRKATRLQWLTVAHVFSAGFVLFLVLSGSQAMRGAWLDDIAGLVPPLAYVIASRYDFRRPTERFPYGYHRAQSIALFWAALSLTLLGLFIVGESVIKLVEAEHAEIGTTTLFGWELWRGWLMLAALAWTGVPQFLLGRAKLPLAEALNDKVLHADADMNKADWMAAAAAAVGVIGLEVGLPWLDPIAAIAIGLEVTRDGFVHTRGVYFHLLGESPRTVDYAAHIDLPEELEQAARDTDWVADARVRMREEGRVLFAEVFVEPVRDEISTAAVQALERDLYARDWRIADLVVNPVTDLDADSELKGHEGRLGQASAGPRSEGR